MADTLLTTLSHVKDWLNIEPSNSNADDYLLRLIKSASQFALNYMQRDSISSQVYSEIYDGYGNSFMVLRQFPVTEILSLSLDGKPIPAAGGDGINTPWTDGYVLEAPKTAPAQQRLTLFGRRFPHSRSSVYVTYKSGYMVNDEAQNTQEYPTDEPTFTFYTLTEDLGVTLEDGTPLTKITTSPDLLQDMEYYCDDEGGYYFAPNQAETKVLISYSYIPPDVEQAVWELVGERYRAQDRIGVNSKSLGGQETVSFDIRSMSPYIRELLNPYRRVVPV